MMYDKEKLNYRLKKYYGKGLCRKILIVIIQLFLIVLTTCETFAYNYLIDKVFVNSLFRIIYIPVALMIGIYFLKAMLTYANQYEYNKFMLEMKEKIRICMLSVFYRSNDNSKIKDIGEVKNRIESDVEELEKYYYSRYIEKYIILIMICIYSVCMIYYNCILAIVCFVIMLIPFLSIKIFGSKVENESKNYRSLYGKYEGKIVQYITNWKEIKSSNMQKECISDFRKDWSQMSRYHLRTSMFKQANSSILSLNRFVLAQAVVYALGGWLLVKNYFEIGELLIFVNYYSRFLERVNAYSDLTMALRNRKNSIDRVMNILDSYLSEKVSKTKLEHSSININHVYYRYENADYDALKDISLNIHDNSLNVIVGKSGSGKSTLLKLIAGIIAPSNGTILVGGNDITTITHESLYDKVTVVMQDSKFFNMTIRENLLISNESATEEDLLKACKGANIYEYVMNLPNQLDTMLSEIAINMSGGEKQRLAIARALCRNTDVYLFDEVTSALDKQNETYITNTMIELAKNHIVICISHRDMILDYADRIICIEDGKIVNG